MSDLPPKRRRFYDRFDDLPPTVRGIIVLSLCTGIIATLSLWMFLIYAA